MGESLWSARADELLARTASADPTPGGGSIAAISGAFGLALVQMALAVTDDPELADHQRRADDLRAAVVPAVDGDVDDFAALMAAYRLPRTDDAERAARLEAVEKAGIAATKRPLDLVSRFVEALTLATEVEPLVKRSIVSDVRAGRDLLVGASRAAVRTADTNLEALDRSGSPQAQPLRARRDALVRAMQRSA